MYLFLFLVICSFYVSFSFYFSFFLLAFMNNINSRLKGAVDQELGGNFIETKSEFSMFDIFAEKLIL